MAYDDDTGSLFKVSFLKQTAMKGLRPEDREEVFRRPNVQNPFGIFHAGEVLTCEHEALR